MSPPDTILKLKIHKNAHATRALPRTPLGECTMLLDPLAGLTEGCCNVAPEVELNPLGKVWLWAWSYYV